MIKWPLIIRRVEGHSMEPTLKPGRIVFATPLLAARDGDIVVVKHEDREIIKRVTQATEEHVILAGDNQDHSRDSRAFGKIDRVFIKGKVFSAK